MSNVVELPKHTQSPILNERQFLDLRRFADDLNTEQLLWVSGYLAGMQGGQPSIPASDHASETVRVTVLFGSQTGTSAALAKRVVERALAYGLDAESLDMHRYRRTRFREDRNLLFIVSTHGDGELPDNAQELYALLSGPRAPKLNNTRYAVLALGDASYPRFCQAGKDFDAALETAGGIRIAERVDCDVDYEEKAERWVEHVLGGLRAQSTNCSSVAPVKKASTLTSWTRYKPFVAQLLDRLPLTAEGASRQVWHLELDLIGSGFDFAAGDSLSIIPSNSPVFVDALIERLGLSGDTPISTPHGELTLAAGLTSRYEISRVTRPFIEHYAALAESTALRELLTDGEALVSWMDGRDVFDVIDEYPVRGLNAQNFVDSLRLLPARRYSIASSPLAYPDEAHLTITPVEFTKRGKSRNGVASSMLIHRIADRGHVPLFFEGQGTFHLPDDTERPIIMIGAGTGIAPYRAFLQEREVLGASGRNWLFFGDRNFRSDFLYQREWLQWLDDGLLTHLDVAFSRDQAHKTYVQDRLHEKAGELYSWLEEGAAVYVCGSERMGHDVHHALLNLVKAAGCLSPDQAEAYVEDLKHTGRYHRDVY